MGGGEAEEVTDDTGSAAAEGADAGRLGRHGESGQRPLRLDVVTQEAHLVERRAPVQVCLFQREDVDRALVARAAQKLRVRTEVDAVSGTGVGEKKAPKTKRFSESYKKKFLTFFYYENTWWSQAKLLKPNS